MTRGVKQGDPLFPGIFNIIMDELLGSIDHSIGLPVHNTRVTALAYADDLVIMAPSEFEAQHLLDHTCAFLARRGLSLNVGKCTALPVVRVPGKNKLCCKSTSPLKRGDGCSTHPRNCSE